MRNLIGLLFGVGLLVVVALNTGGIKFGATTSPLALPAAQRTAINARADATRTASNALSNVSAADAKAQEQEAARVYAQAQADDLNKRRSVATEQAALATRVSGDDMVSRQYATLSAVSINATVEAISQTMSINKVTYNNTVSQIMATQQATQNQMLDKADTTDRQNSVTYFWTWLPTIGALVIAALVIRTLWKLIGKIEPRIEYIEPDPTPPTEQPQVMDPPINKMAGIVFDSADPRTLLYNIVLFSGRHIGWSQNRIAGTGDIGSAISGRSWDMAIKWGKEHYGLVSQQGQGTYVPGDIGSLANLLNRLRLDPAIDALPEATPTPQ